jgi:hypothetical protein
LMGILRLTAHPIRAFHPSARVPLPRMQRLYPPDGQARRAPYQDLIINQHEPNHRLKWGLGRFHRHPKLGLGRFHRHPKWGLGRFYRHIKWGIGRFHRHIKWGIGRWSRNLHFMDASPPANSRYGQVPHPCHPKPRLHPHPTASITTFNFSAVSTSSAQPPLRADSSDTSAPSTRTSVTTLVGPLISTVPHVWYCVNTIYISCM